MDVVASYRAKSFCDHFVSVDIFPTLVTHRWERDDAGKWIFHRDSDVVVETRQNCTIIRVPRQHSTRKKFGKIQTLFNFLTGNIDGELISSYRSFRKFLLDYLTTEAFDALLVIYSPHFQMKLAHELKRKFGLPYITDFRDLWDNQVITRSYHPTLKKKLIDGMVRYWWKRWIKDAEFFTTTGETWRRFLENLSGRPGYVIRNGFESELISTTRAVAKPREFVITHFGRLYPTQDVVVFLEGYKQFLQQEGTHGIKLEIIGNKPLNGIKIEEITEKLPAYSVAVIPYQRKEDLLEYCRNCTSVFWMPGFKEDNGQFPVKVYDYLLLRKNILFAPGNASDVQQVIMDSRAGAVCNTPQEVCAQLHLWYSEYKIHGFLPCNSNVTVIQQFTRMNQVRILAEIIHARIH
jgi:glycosyltransferase involved in cell wall biosynthesis